MMEKPKLKLGDRPEILRSLPSVAEILSTDAARAMEPGTGKERLTKLARAAVDAVRAEIQTALKENGSQGLNASRQEFIERSLKAMQELWTAERRTRLRRVINATGVVIHTNLGRAPLSESAKAAVLEQASGYCTLEYDLETGKRGRRGARAEELLAELTGAESAVVVNNGAAAAFLVVTAFAAGKEVIVSRGELVEIGGDFRVPDVLSQSGAKLVEVGTTNRTKTRDYLNAVNENTAMILNVHPSNYKIVGFTERPGLQELAELAKAKGLLLCQDAGSGALIDLADHGLGDEPVIPESFKLGADLVSFSGDKLLGGPQAGIVAGRADLIEKLRRHPLYRVLRADKLVFSALEATLDAYARGNAIEEIPVLKMLAASPEDTAARAKQFVSSFTESAGKNIGSKLELIEGSSVVGGGAAAGVEFKSTLIALNCKGLSAEAIEERLRSADPPVIARIVEDRVVLDLRTVDVREESQLNEILRSVCV